MFQTADPLEAVLSVFRQVSVIMETRLLFVNHQRGWSARRVVETGNAATVASNDGKAIKKAYCQGWERDDSDRRALHFDMLGLAQPTLAASTRFHQGLDTADPAGTLRACHHRTSHRRLGRAEKAGGVHPDIDRAGHPGREISSCFRRSGSLP